MDGFRSQFLLECRVHQLVLANAIQPIESRRDNRHLQMISATGEILHGDGCIWKSFTDGGFDISRLNHGNTTALKGC